MNQEKINVKGKSKTVKITYNEKVRKESI